MLVDFFTYLTNPCSQHIRRMGYLSEAIAMRDRYRRRQAAWTPHLDKTREFVLSAAEKCRGRNKIVILGSGLLLDVPLADISSMYQEVELLDVVCLPGARKIIKKFSNVTFVEHDVTGIAEQLYRNKEYGIHELPEAGIDPGRSHKADLVVSLNIISQLWVIPRQFAALHMPGVTEDQLDEWCRQIVESHYALLRQLSCSVCMIADFEFVKRDRESTIFSRGSTVSGLALPEPDASWTWHIEPIQTESQFHSRELSVGAWLLR